MQINSTGPAVRDAAARALAPICALLLSLIALALSWFSREFTHDDFYLAYLAWIRSTDLIPGRDYIVPNFTPLAELSAPLFAAFPESLAPLDILRLPIFLASLGLLGLTYETARRLSGSRAWGGAAACVVAWHPQVILRIADIRSDAIAAAVLLVA
ncbi:MAG TPA: hypothetical protein VLV48_08720, partial [Thermoanaerobaculia bacterium]|nr:hypothetical protein [Thermoanaerobaculia bacterium]